MRRVALVANQVDCDPGLVGRALRARGYSFVEFLREDHGGWPGDLVGVDMVLLLGSCWCAYEHDEAEGPAIQAERRLIVHAIARALPVMGICFGSQQLATVLGGTVQLAVRPEVGWCPLTVVSPDASLPACLASGEWLQWHFDNFSVPPGATLLAESPAGPQLLVCGRSLCVQFHPEATESVVQQFTTGVGVRELEELGLRGEDIVSATGRRCALGGAAGAAGRCDELVQWFLEHVAPAAAVPLPPAAPSSS
jgi:GMP synthase-like glutamine amidotransferase